MEKCKPTNKRLWDKSIREAKKRYKKWPSAYASGFASKFYKQNGGKWKCRKAN